MFNSSLKLVFVSDEEISRGVGNVDPVKEREYMFHLNAFPLTPGRFHPMTQGTNRTHP